MATSVKQMMGEVNAAVPRITPGEAKELIAKGTAVVVDIPHALEAAGRRPLCCDATSTDVGVSGPTMRHRAEDRHLSDTRHEV